MGWFSELLAPAPKALCVRLPGCYLIDLSPLPANVDRVTRAVKQIVEAVRERPEPLQVWVMPPHLAAHYDDAGATTSAQVQDLLAQLLGASSGASLLMMFEGEPPRGLGYLLRSCGFELARENLKLQLQEGDRVREIVVLEQLAKVRATPNNGTVMI